MLVLMEPGSDEAAVSAVCDAARAAMLDADRYTDGGRVVVALSGEVSAAARAQIAALPGVAAVMARAEDGPPRTRDLRIASIRPLVQPAILTEDLPLPLAGAEAVTASRAAVSAVLRGTDDRLLVVVGPCSIHDTEAARDYAAHLRPLADELADDLLIVMRVYFEKPRTTVGWKGLINDPRMDGSFAINVGLHRARGLLLDLVAMGLPVGCEFLDPILPQFLADVVTWGAIGARTTESQIHRELASGLSMPVGFKNGTGGGVQMAIDALHAAAHPHQFLSVTEQGVAAIVATRGNTDCHVILRGGTRGPNYSSEHVRPVLESLRNADLPPRVMIDTSHGNSDKDYRRQPEVAAAVGAQVAAGERGILGLMIESFLVEGRQDLRDPAHLTYGQSLTDSCMGWETTVPVLRDLAAAVRARRTA